MNDKAIALRRSELIPAASEIQNMLSFAKTLFEGGLLPDSIKTPQAAFTVIQKGVELAIPPMAAMAGIYVANGKASCSAELIGALIYRDHGNHALNIIETTGTYCTIAYRRRDWPEAKRFSFTIEDAKRADLLSGKNAHNWRKYPAAMLRARCISAIGRMAFPDSIGGMYTHEELDLAVDAQGDIVIVEHVTPNSPQAETSREAEPEAEPVEAEYRAADPEPTPAVKPGNGPHATAPRTKIEASYRKAIKTDWSHEHLIAWLRAHDVPGDGLDAMNHLTNSQLDALNRDIINERMPTPAPLEQDADPDPEPPPMPMSAEQLAEFDFPDDETDA